MATILSVNGQDGEVLARSSGIRLVQEDSQALQLWNEDRASGDGRPGEDARREVSGGPGGTLAVRLSESNISHGAITVQVVDHHSTHRLPPVTEVPTGRELVLTAIGGIGEAGGNGGDGRRGVDGIDGTDATKVSEATNGTDGGRGGAAGRGTNGANGGDGGRIDIILHEDSTHLLMAVSTDVRGGPGGIAGKHGKPGPGGKGGKKGLGFKWEELLGYKPFCTDNCTKNGMQSSTSSALTHVGSRVGASGSALMARAGALTVSGNIGNVQQMIAQTAVRHNATRRQITTTGGGYCKCGGGDSTATCTGCGQKPIFKTCVRPTGLDGKDGQRGARVTTSLVAGRQGQEGEVRIVVYHSDGSPEDIYFSPWALELVGFEMEDENGDGIFEPGEHLFIKRIQIQNVGGMPSPTCRIPITLTGESEWFEPVGPEEGGRTYLPRSIPAGGSASTEGSIKVKIKERVIFRVASLQTPFKAKDTLNIRADMPWLDRRMPSFDLTREVELSYPICFGDFDYLGSVAQRGRSMAKCEIRNLGNLPVGTPGPGREVEVRVTIPPAFGCLIGQTEDEQEVFFKVPNTRPKDLVTIAPRFRVLATARSHAHFNLTFELYLESAAQDLTNENAAMILVEQHTITLQVSNKYAFNEDSDILLITNSATTEYQSRAVQQFVISTLGMNVDIYNAEQNGGLLQYPEDDFQPAFPVTKQYPGKTVIVLDNTFNFYGQDRSISQLFDPQWLSDMATKGTSCLFIGRDQAINFDEVARLAVLPVSTKAEDSSNQIKKSNTRIFASAHELVKAITEEKPFGHARLELSAVPLIRPKWYRIGRDKPTRQAKAVARHLRNQLPGERCLVTIVAPGLKRLSPDDSQLIVLTGLDHHNTMSSIAAGLGISDSPGNNSTQAPLDNFSKYMIVSALPFRQRIRFLWTDRYLDFVVKRALTLSVVRDLFREIDCMEISIYRQFTRVIVDSSDITAIDIFFRIHLPHMADLFNQSDSHPGHPPPGPIQEVLQWTLGFSASMKRHKGLYDLIQAMTEHRLGPRDFKNLQSTNKEPATYTMDALIREISQLTQRPPYDFTRGERSSSDVVETTRYCPPGEWNEIVRKAGEWRARLEDDMERAQKELGRMMTATFDFELDG